MKWHLLYITGNTTVQKIEIWKISGDYIHSESVDYLSKIEWKEKDKFVYNTHIRLCAKWL